MYHLEKNVSRWLFAYLQHVPQNKSQFYPSWMKTENTLLLYAMREVLVWSPSTAWAPSCYFHSQFLGQEFPFHRWWPEIFLAVHTIDTKLWIQNHSYMYNLILAGYRHNTNSFSFSVSEVDFKNVIYSRVIIIIRLIDWLIIFWIWDFAEQRLTIHKGCQLWLKIS